MEHYEDNNIWRSLYTDIGYELGEIIDEQQNIILSLKRENKKLRREKRNLKQTKGRRR